MSLEEWWVCTVSRPFLIIPRPSSGHRLQAGFVPPELKTLSCRWHKTHGFWHMFPTWFPLQQPHLTPSHLSDHFSLSCPGSPFSALCCCPGSRLGSFCSHLSVTSGSSLACPIHLHWTSQTPPTPQPFHKSHLMPALLFPHAVWNSQASQWCLSDTQRCLELDLPPSRCASPIPAAPLTASPYSRCPRKKSWGCPVLLHFPHPICHYIEWNPNPRHFLNLSPCITAIL